jgi:hypothetical protein
MLVHPLVIKLDLIMTSMSESEIIAIKYPH